MNIVTHTNPDWDAIASVWLLKRYGGMESADVAFVNTGAPDADTLAVATAVVDTGRELDPLRLRFDHHQLPGAEANTCCAASLVFQWLRAEQPGMEAIGPLVDLIYAGDTGQANYGATWSRVVGIHALLSGLKAGRRAGDADILAWGMTILDLLAASLIAHEEARRTLEQYTVWRSHDGLIVALRNAPQGATYAAHEAGARLVLFQTAHGHTNAIGIMRGGEAHEPHCGRLVIDAIECTSAGMNSKLYAELASWYRHEAGFFAGRGTLKAPDPRPVEVDLVEIAEAIDAVWIRR